MPNRKKRNITKTDWYKIISIIISVVGVYIVIENSVSDFSISIDPMVGAAQQGDLTHTMISISSEGILGYKDPVILSVGEQYPGIVVTFNSIDGLTPPYTSIATINVASGVPAKNHKIIINGKGADGKEHIVEYILTVKPMPPVEIKITDPKEGNEVNISTIIHGTISGKLSEDQYVWLVVHPHKSDSGEWWPQGVGSIYPRNGPWEIRAQFGGENETGTKFDIAIILVNEKGNQYYLDYIREGRNKTYYPGIPLPASANMVDKITVTQNYSRYK